MASLNTLNRNVAAFLDMIAVSEGTAGHGDDGYNVIVGYTYFHDYRRHPKIKVRLGHGLVSSAAGRYQFLGRTWDGLQSTLKLPDFSPASQDQAARELIRRRSALGYVEEGQFDQAIQLCRKEWASLPGAGYGQHENGLGRLRTAYLAAGGRLAKVA